MKILFVVSCVLFILFSTRVNAQQIGRPLPPHSVSYKRQNPPIGGQAAPIILRHYPASGAREVPTVTQIGISASAPFMPGVLLPQSWQVIGQHTGVHTGRTHFSDDSCTVIFVPDIPFDTDENVSIVLSGPPCTPPLCQFCFTTTILFPQGFVVNPPPFIDNALLSNTRPRRSVGERSLDQFFTVTVDNNPTPGLIFLSVFGVADLGEIMITDENSNILLDLPVPATDFVQQPNGEYTYFGPPEAYYGIDTLGNVFQKYTCANGVQTDGHEFCIEPDGSYYMLGLSQTAQDLSAIGGIKGAIAQSGVIQSFDASGNLVFEWRGIDHYNVADDVIPGDIKNSVVDFQHANSIDIDADGNYLLSNRNLSEVTKIDANTGNIIWRFGGHNNQFKLIGDTLGISCQHYARYLDNGDILLFDNGVYHATPESRAAEFNLDTARMTATLTWQFQHNPPVFSDVMGNAERLDNGNTFIGWGDNLDVSATEVDTSGNVIYEMQLPFSDNSYRALKYPYILAGATGLMSVAANNFQPNQLSIEKTANGFNLSVQADIGDNISLTLFDEMGRNVRTVYDGPAPAASSQYSLATQSLPAGAYFCVLRTKEGSVSKMVAVTN